MSNKNFTNSYLDNQGVSKYLNYSQPQNTNDLDSNSINTSNVFNTLSRNNLTSQLNLSQLNTLTDSKNFNNPLKYELVTKGSKTHLTSQSSLNSSQDTHEFELFNQSLGSNMLHTNKTLNYTFEDLKSGNQSLLPGERTVRLTDKLNPQKNLNTSEEETLQTSLNDVFRTSQTNNSSYIDLNRFTGTTTTFPIAHNPLISSNPSVKNLGYDRTFIENKSPTLLQSKEESAPNIIFETY
jgi:hypothetical protein